MGLLRILELHACGSDVRFYYGSDLNLFILIG